MRNLFRILSVTLALQGAFAVGARAQDEIVSALPDSLHKPLAAFLAATGWKDADKLTASTRYWQLTEQVFLVRVTGKTTCDANEDLCLTIIGRTQNGGLIAETVFYAGARLEAANNSFALGGKDGPSLFFVRLYGKTQNVTAIPAPTGWIVIPSAALDDFKGPKN